MDALLGAAGMADIGALFPDTDPAFKDACSVDCSADVAAPPGRRGLAAWRTWT